jgi:hypothetical protein
MAKTLEQQADDLKPLVADSNIAALARESGLSERWLRYFVRNKIPNPGVLTLDAVASALKLAAKKK